MTISSTQPECINEPVFAKTITIIGAGPVGLAAAAHAFECGRYPVGFLKPEPKFAIGSATCGYGRIYPVREFSLDTAAKRLLSGAAQ